jgi:hypothetical protein
MRTDRGLARCRLWLAAVCAAALIGLATSGPAQGEDPGRWIETGHANVPLEYFQGITSEHKQNLFFDGVFVGLYRTDSRLNEEARNTNVIPPAVRQTEGYNHIGDLTWDRSEHGRLLLPLECFLNSVCGRGAFGVADPDTLQWRYYVNLDPSFIDKAMWAEVAPDHRLVWTSSGSGDDLLAYRLSDIDPRNAGPDGPRLRPVRRLVGAVPPSGITGATFYKKRLFLAGQDGPGPFQVWSVDLGDGSRQLEIEREIVGESEGLDVVKTLGGVLHWLIVPFQTGGQPPTYGEGHSALVHFVPRHGAKPR